MSDETKKVNDGGQAFPMVRDMTNNPNWDYHPGMSLRDWFAGMALQGAAGNLIYEPADWVALSVYRIADAMIERRKR